MSFDAYDYTDSNTSEQYNTLVLLDNVLAKHSIRVRPEFHILGGTALLFHGVSAVVTIDIDTANRLTDEVKAVVEPFISDNASEVATLAKNYKQRLVAYKPEIFKNIDVYILSLEDIVITKLGAGRHKDIEDLTKTDLLKKCDYSKLFNIINTEFATQDASNLLIKLSTL